MLERYKKYTDSYYYHWLRLANIAKKASIYPIDFKRHWFSVISTKGSLLASALVSVTLIEIFYTLYPLLFPIIMENLNFTYFLYMLGLWFGVILLELFALSNAAFLEVQCINSVMYNSFTHFLTVDPLYHTMKSTGKLFAKVERCAIAYEDFLDIILWEIMPVMVSMVSVVITFLWIDFTLGCAALLLLCAIAGINISLNLFTSASFEQRLINADDSVKSLAVESLTQVQLIRASFATNEIADLSKQRSESLMVKQGTAWFAFGSAVTVSRIAYLASVLLLGYIVFGLITEGSLTVLQGTTVLLTYLTGTSEIIEIGRRIRKLLRAVTRITDLYSFIQSFGKQTYPVLDAPEPPEVAPTTPDAITLRAEKILFFYTTRAKIFDGHRLYLSVPDQAPTKLYGIIGPSGIGKTTLLSVLGGQLKPDAGSVSINGVPIYHIDDAARRSLIAIQGQSASSLSGTLRRNLLLGLPLEQQVYTDEEIIRTLEQVGIWKIFEQKEGLATPIGEAGLTLSGGQRQRLNFASLYLRAKYYLPLVILIDEPTSSLDEVSERAITSMIGELAQRAVTIVIAHRLKTLDKAVGICDFSLIETEKEISFYPRQELEEKSPYYRKLLQGDIPLQ